MTISSQTRKAGPFVGNDSTTAFPFAFKVFTAADMYVVKTDTDLEVETVLVLNTDYTVSLNADQNANPGGTITLPTALATGFTLTVTSNISPLQQTDLTNQGGFYPSVITNALDKLTILIQQALDSIGRSLKLPVSTPSGVSTTLPLPSSNKLIGWNQDADGLQNVDPTTLATIVAFGTANADVFSGDGVTTQFNLSANPAALNNLDVSIGGVTQTPGVDYTWTSGTVITFTSAPGAGSGNVLVRYMQALPQGAADWNALTNNPVIDVKRYGAVGDGVTDDTAAIQLALNLVNSTSGGQIIYFPRGDYLVSNLSLSGKKGLQLVGDAGSVYSVIKVTGKITCNNVGDFTVTSLMFVGDVFNFTTRGLTGSPTANNCLFDMVDNCADWRVTGCKFYGFDTVFRPNLGATNGSYIVKIRDNYFGWNNTPIRADVVLHWNIEGNTFSEDRVANIHITSGGEVTIANNKFENSANPLSTGNIYFGTGSTLVLMNSTIIGNTFHQSYGIYLNKVSRVVVSSNVVRQPKVADTLVINSCEEIDVISNQLYGYDGTYRRSGIDISATTGFVNVVGNVVRDYATGVYVSSDYTVQVTGNIIGGATYSVCVTGCTTDRRVTVSENTLLGTVRSDGNSNYWTERNNNVIAGTKFDNNDGKMDNYYLEGVWTPAPTSLTVVGTPTYTGTFVKVGKNITCYADISSTTSTACTGGTTYFSGLPYASVRDGSVTSVTTGAAQGGVGLATGIRAYPAAWTASAAVRLKIDYSI